MSRDSSAVAPKPHRPFIPAWLDEAGLTPQQFRVYCHLERRADHHGVCWPSAPTIATACRISRDTVWAALRVLEAVGLIERQKHFRNSNRYLLTRRVGGKDGPTESVESAEKEGRQSAEKEGCQSAESTGRQSAEKACHKGYPMKDPQLRVPSERVLSALPSELEDSEYSIIKAVLRIEKTENASAVYREFRLAKLTYPKDWMSQPRSSLPELVISYFTADRRGVATLARMRGAAVGVDALGWPKYSLAEPERLAPTR